MGRLFGTDGIRGIANKDLTCELATQLGRAAAQVLTNKSNLHPRVLIGKDTRLSSDMLENAMAAGLCSIGASVLTLGVVPTPAVAFLVGIPPLSITASRYSPATALSCRTIWRSA